MDEPIFYCFYGNVHVLTGARLIGTFGFLLFSFLISFLFTEQFIWLTLMIFFIFIIPFILLIFADRQRSSKFYLPFLLLNVLLILLNTFYLIFIGIMILFIPNFWKNHLELSLDIKENKKNYLIITILIFIIFLLIQLILFWCYSVVVNAYNYMNKDKIILIPPQLPSNLVKNRKNKKYLDNRISQLA